MLRNRQRIRLVSPVRGIDLRPDYFSKLSGENRGIFSPYMQNCIYRAGVEKRPGTVLFRPTAVGNVNSIVSFRLNQTLVSNLETINVLNDSGVITISTFFSGKKRVSVWEALSRAYVSNGISPVQRFDGTTFSPITGIPPGIKMTLPYRSRLLMVDSVTPSSIGWPNVDYSDAGPFPTELIRVPGPGKIESLTIHSATGLKEGIDAKVFVAKTTSIHLFSCLDFNIPPLTIENGARLDEVSSSVGCIAPLSVVNTPIGTIFLGSDSQVYLLRYGSLDLIPIGSPLQAKEFLSIGIDSVQVNEIRLAAAVYHDGFYKLSINAAGTRLQYWLDVESTQLPWFGPMIGKSVVVYGKTESNKLLMADTDGFLYSESGELDTDASGANVNITMIYKSPFDYLSPEETDSEIMATEIDSSSTTVTVSVDLNDSVGIVGGFTFTPGSSSVKWGAPVKWGSFKWSPKFSYVRSTIRHFQRGLRGRFLSMSFKHVGGYFSLINVVNVYKVFRAAFPARATALSGGVGGGGGL